MSDSSQIKEIIIPKEKAVFWMDARGRWCNEHGPFEHARIIAYFNQSIRKDRDGYFVEQVRDGMREKVYFYHHDTPLFIVDTVGDDPAKVILNTGAYVDFCPQRLIIRNDQLYMRINDDEIAKFNERTMMHIAAWIDYHEGRVYFQIDDSRIEIPEG